MDKNTSINIVSLFGIERFDGRQNFVLWQGSVRDALVLQGLKEALCDTKPDKMEEEKWKKICGKALSAILILFSG